MPTELHPIKPQGTTVPPAHGRSPVIRGGGAEGGQPWPQRPLHLSGARERELRRGPLLLLVAHCYVAAARPMIDSLLGE